MNGALAGLCLALGPLRLANAQEETPKPTAPPPASFEFDRAVGPLAFDVVFQLADKDDAHLQILFDEPEDRSYLTFQERVILGVEFQPFEGVRFVLSRSTINAPLVSSVLQQVPEPKDLEFKLHVELPQEGGLAVTLPDGFPVVIAATPHARKMTVQFAASGGVVAFSATKPERVSKLKFDAKAEAEMARLDALAPTDPLTFAATLGPGIDREIKVATPLKQVRSVDRQEVAGGILERFVAEFEEGVESPLIVLRPTGDAKVAALLVVAGERDGIASASVRAALQRGVAEGRLVAAFEPIGVGERRSILPHDDVHVPELELVGTSSFDLATIEGLQLLAWLRARADVDAQKIAVTGADCGTSVAEQIGWLDRDAKRDVLFEKLSAATTELPIESVHVGDDYLHLRFDSCQLLRAQKLQEESAPPDESIPILDRVRSRGHFRGGLNGMTTLVQTPGEPPVRWNSMEPPPKFAKHVTIVASDRGMRVGLEEAAARLPSRDDETWIALDPKQLEFVEVGGFESSDLEYFLKNFAKARGPDAEPPRIFTDGAAALPLLTTLLHLNSITTAADVKFPVFSFTACHAIPSFDILLKRPYTAHRADPSLEVLTQGMPEWVFVPNALTRFEIEDLVIALTVRGLKVDWQDPVDALRRPLSRHDRLAMWPQYRHAEFVRPR